MNFKKIVKAEDVNSPIRTKANDIGILSHKIRTKLQNLLDNPVEDADNILYELEAALDILNSVNDKLKRQYGKVYKSNSI